MNNPFLTIAIPTYNRSESLNICLSSLIPQVQGFGNEIEIIVANNASTDDTKLVIDNFRKQLNSIRYLESETNRGPDVNISKCFDLAKGRFVWIFSDDDLLKTNALSLIMHLLKGNLDCGVCYVRSEWYDEIYLDAIKPALSLNERVYDSNIDFINEVNYWITFLTAVIFNKKALGGSISFKENIGTYLVQLSWTIPAIFLSKKNIIVNEKIIVCKSNNSGGYKIYEVFSINFNKILDRLIKKNIINKLIKDIINKNLIIDFFPRTIKLNNKNYDNNQAFIVLFKSFWNYKEFWRFIIPLYIKSNKIYLLLQSNFILLAKSLLRKVKSKIKNILGM